MRKFSAIFSFRLLLPPTKMTMYNQGYKEQRLKAGMFRRRNTFEILMKGRESYNLRLVRNESFPHSFVKPLA